MQEKEKKMMTKKEVDEVMHEIFSSLKDVHKDMKILYATDDRALAACTFLIKEKTQAVCVPFANWWFRGIQRDKYGNYKFKYSLSFHAMYEKDANAVIDALWLKCRNYEVKNGCEVVLEKVKRKETPVRICEGEVQLVKYVFNFNFCIWNWGMNGISRSCDKSV